MHFADVPPDEPQGETECCDFSVYSVVVQIKKQILNYVRQTSLYQTNF